MRGRIRSNSKWGFLSHSLLALSLLAASFALNGCSMFMPTPLSQNPAAASSSGGDSNTSNNQSSTPTLGPTNTVMSSYFPLLVQSGTNSGSGSPVTVTLSQPTAAGDFIVIGMNDLDGITSIVDDAPGGSDVFVTSNARATLGGQYAAQIWYAANVKAGATHVTVTWNSGMDGEVYVEEFFGIVSSNPVDQIATLADQNACCDIAPTVTTSVANELVYSVVDEGDTVTGISPGNPFIGLPILSGNAAAYYIAQTADLSTGAAWDKDTNSNYSAVTASFLPGTPSAGAASLTFVTPAQNVSASTCSGVVTLQTQNGAGAPQSVSQSITISLAGSGLTLYSDSQCSNPITQLSMNAGQSSASFYFQGFAGSYLIEAESPGYTVVGQTDNIVF